MEKGVGREFTNQTRSVKKNVHSAERKQSKSNTANNNPDSEESLLHSAETTDSDSTSETDDECNFPDSEQNSQHSAESEDKPISANGEKKKLRVRKRKKHEVKLLSQTLQLDKNNHMMYIPLTFDKTECQGLLDTGAVQSAMSETELAKILRANPKALIKELPAPNFKIQIANGSVVPIRKQVLLRFEIAGTSYEETFIILPQMSTILIGMTFFTNYEVMIDIVNYLIHLPEISLQLKQKNGKFKQPLSEMTSEQTIKLQPGQQVIIPTRTDGLKTDTHGTITGHPVFHRKSSILVTPAMTIVKGGIAHIQITNPTQQVCTIRKGTAIASFKILTPNQAKYVKEMPPTHLNLLQRFPDDAEAVVNQLFREQNEVLSRKWYPTPETCDDPTKLNKLERRIYDEII